MALLSTADLLGQLNWRYATKQFDPQRKISAADWAALEDRMLELVNAQRAMGARCGPHPYAC